MFRGVSFKIPQVTANILWEIFSSIDITKYCWYNIKNQTEVWDEHSQNSFFVQECYGGNEFKNCIQANHYMIFLKLQAYFQFSDFKNIHTYDEFIKSDCQLILLVYDCEYVEIYSKDQVVIHAIYQRAKDKGYNNVNYITESNDGRTKMDIC